MGYATSKIIIESNRNTFYQILEKLDELPSKATELEPVTADHAKDANEVVEDEDSKLTSEDLDHENIEYEDIIDAIDQTEAVNEEFINETNLTVLKASMSKENNNDQPSDDDELELIEDGEFDENFEDLDDQEASNPFQNMTIEELKNHMPPYYFMNNKKKRKYFRTLNDVYHSKIKGRKMRIKKEQKVKIRDDINQFKQFDKNQKIH